MGPRYPPSLSAFPNMLTSDSDDDGGRYSYSSIRHCRKSRIRSCKSKMRYNRWAQHRCATTHPSRCCASKLGPCWVLIFCTAQNASNDEGRRGVANEPPRPAADSASQQKSKRKCHRRGWASRACGAAMAATARTASLNLRKLRRRRTVMWAVGG